MLDTTFITDPMKWEAYVRQYPQAWQYCRKHGTQIVHAKNTRTGQWECMACNLERNNHANIQSNHPSHD